MVRLSALEEFLMGAMSGHLEEAFRAGACPDELLAAVTVVYLRSAADYRAHGRAADVPVRVGQQFHRSMYVTPEVV